METNLIQQSSSTQSWTNKDFIELISVHDNKSKLKTYQQVRSELFQKAPPKAVIVYTHGMGSYVDKLCYIAKIFAENGYDFVGYDSLGFGYSEGERGVINSIEDYFEDAYQFTLKVINYYQDLYSESPAAIQFINYGYSLGVRVSIAVQRLYKLRYSQNLFSVFLWQSPYFDLKIKDPEYLAFLEETCLTEPSKIVLRQNTETQIPQKNSDEKDQKIYVADPIAQYGPYQAKTELMFMKKIEYLVEYYKEIDVPIFVAFANQDQAVDNDDAAQMIKTFKTPREQIESNFYESEHNILWAGRDVYKQIVSDQLAFLDRVLQK
ncbi:UNKNOWN [Stylonychia lemnae]|uniref:Serine aminopeptidase S33 domain-containing protein n=1 Tax=Stylonychia lemnae TaxID=5949 RepID=A0A078ARH6_STYLE|nr:UNKNOWN [Stylonychia lemnae]|eukprot:CDW84814.1 UNKNOWN [Stylonychia lemnae]